MNYRLLFSIALFLLTLTSYEMLHPSFSFADEPPTFDSLDEGTNQVSPKEGWGKLEVVEEKKKPIPFYVELLLWPVNRFLDLVDIVRIDVGAGTSYGGILRVTRQGSLGYRHVEPGALRVGSFGRKPPFLLEHGNEGGAGRHYRFSPDREVCDAEVGVGLDLFIGAYVGVCFEGLIDFLGGIVFLDPDDDDIR